MKQALQLKLSQHLTLTPQLQQSIRLLQLSTIELNAEIEQMLADNPMLERDDEQSADAGSFGAEERVQTESIADAFAGGPEGTPPDTDWGEREPGAPMPGAARSDDDEDSPSRQIAAAGTTLRENLLQQVTLMRLSHRDRGLVSALIEALDHDGYLSMPLAEIYALLPEEFEVEEGDLETALKLLQTCDPPGVAARNLTEALLLQLREFGDEPALALARAIVTAHLVLLAARDFAQIKRLCKCGDSELKAARELILRLNPRPGAQFDSVDTRYVKPDVIVRRVKSAWKVAINPEAVPRLKINRMYADILSRERGRGGNGDGSGLVTQLQEAKWLLKNVLQRFETIERVAQAVVERQRHFFDHGEVAMRPLVLREIADELGLHESTISRVTTNKYMLTPRGLFELKYFFGSHVATDSGGACSSTAIRALIKQLVSAEEVKRPLSDSKIAEILGQQGIVVARRTIAKYRDALKIPPANLRKSL